MKRIMIAMAIALAFAACEKKGDQNPDPGEAEVVVTESIPEELEDQAEQEITAENVDEAAAELEKEIEADSE